ncbi:probable serine/threonine-protein kinase drkD [Solanum tuberosum]|uniref:probable serine/threonine-protein kinase drkD n=1 Tax=Solanum tuberosum TaxID=4113 RepID=UPI00073A0504|nr:PREDICTED: probable serine/threonine-protein kinase drkD [Solanum tuberosum]
MGSKRVVVVVHDTSKEVNWTAIRGVVRNFSLEAGDELILLGVVHQFNNSTTTSAFLSTVKLLGQRNKVDQKLVEEELVKRMEEYNKSLEMLVLLKQCEVHKVKFHIQVQAGNSRKVVAVIAIKREMKKEKKYFMEKLSCGISKLKSDNSIEDVRGPLKLMENTKVSLTRNTFSYDEMIPGEDDSSEERPSSQQNSKAVSRTRTSCKEQASSIPGNSPSHFSDDQNQKHEHIKDNEREEIFDDQYLYGVISEKSECSFCGNRRPKMRLHKDFSYKELEEATKGFSNENFLSEGGFGSVYKGYLNGLRVAVKQHNDMSLQGDKEFKSEVEVLSKARHPNLVMLLGSCSEGSQKLLVYEYVCYGSLDKFLSGKFI